MAGSPTSIRQRGGQPVKKDKAIPAPLVTGQKDTDGFVKPSRMATARSEWDYKLALLVITIMAFATRFWGINHPNEVVFDEVHFGKVRNLLRTRAAKRSKPIKNSL